MVWGCITQNGPGRLHQIDGIMDAKQYCSILSESLLGTLEDHNLTSCRIIFQQDNDPKHKSRLATAWFKENKITVLPWPLNSPNINIIESVWDYLERRIHTRAKQPSNKEELWVALQEEWANIDKDFIKKLYDSLLVRVAKLKQAQGSYTRY
jgi:transposase